MNINEFSIACKLINLKLRGFEIPKLLPPILLASLSNVSGTPTLTPSTSIGSLSPLDPLKSLTNQLNTNTISPPARPMIPPQPIASSMMSGITSIMQPQQQQLPIMSQSLISGMGGVVTNQPITMTMPQPKIIPMQPLIPNDSVSSSYHQIGSIGNVNSLIDTGTNNLISPTNDSSLLIGTTSSGFGMTSSGNVPAPPTPPQSNTPNRAMSIVDRAPSLESPNSGQQGEWAIKGPTKLKYTQIFNTTDRSRSGFLTGVQARHLMVQTKLPQAILAQIWALADMDSDGRLGCDEFVLAMYLCDLALQGESIPSKLAPDLIPPAFRKVLSRHGSIAGSVGGTPGSVGGVGGSITSRHGSVSLQGASIGEADPSAGLPGQSKIIYINFISLNSFLMYYYFSNKFSII